MSVITTHISWVFVTDHEVWKLKRPVDYGFVDYTVAGRLTAFYATSASGSNERSLDVLRANVEENFDQVRPFVGRFVDADTFETVRSWQLGCLARDRLVFDARREEGRIRDGHGDLRLEHVYFERDQPIVIDAIEFNERFRIGDIAADVAFLATELDARSRSDLAESFLAAFARESGDYDLYGVVDFYLSYRAWVRGKVASFLAADPATSGEKAQRKSQEAKTLFALARTYASARPEAGALVAVGGVIGAGKSTLSDALGRSLRCPVIDSDRTPKSLAGIPATQQAQADAYTAAFTDRTYDELFRRADVVLSSGRGVVLDATFRDRHLRLRARELARRHERPFRFAEAICDDTTLRTRLRARAAGVSVSDATEVLLEQIRREFDPVNELAVGEHLPVRTTLPLSRQVQAVRDTLAG